MCGTKSQAHPPYTSCGGEAHLGPRCYQELRMTEGPWYMNFWILFCSLFPQSLVWFLLGLYLTFPFNLWRVLRKSMCPCLSFPGAWAESPKFVIGEFDTGVSKSGVTANLFAWVVFVPLQMPLTYLGTSLCVTEFGR